MMKPAHTFCPRLWEEIYISEKGDVYSCCHFKPAPWGNIYGQKLIGLVNNDEIRSFRKQALEGKLSCYRHCRLLDKAAVRYEPKPLQIDYGRLKRIKLRFGTACNIRCAMCGQDHRDPMRLDLEKLMGAVDFGPFSEIEIQGGEPLFMDVAKSFFDQMVSQGKKVSFLTNGLLINPEWAEKIARHSAFVYFSLNAATRETHERVNKGSHWGKVLANIKLVTEAKEKIRAGVMICGHMTITLDNLKEIPQFIKRSREFGFEKIDFGYVAFVPLYLMLRPFFKNNLKKAINEAIAETVFQHQDINAVALKRLNLIA